MLQGSDCTELRADAYSTPERTRLEVAAPGVLINDSGSELTATLISGPSHGSLVLEPSGGFEYVPGPSFQGGTDSFMYSIGESEAAPARAPNFFIPTKLPGHQGVRL